MRKANARGKRQRKKTWKRAKREKLEKLEKGFSAVRPGAKGIMSEWECTAIVMLLREGGSEKIAVTEKVELVSGS